MARIKITKGHNIRIAGKPAANIIQGDTPGTVAYQPVEFRYIKPKLMVQEGDVVKLGTPLFFDKRNPEVKWASPGGGTVKAIHFGPRRVIEKIIIELDKHEESEQYNSYSHQEIAALTKEAVRTQILDSGLWPMIRQRPFNKIADPNSEPSSIFISCINSAPLSVDLDIALRNRRSSFQAGVNALSRLTEGKVNIVVSDDSLTDTFIDVENAETHYISGPHPAGNVGIQIHHIDPLKPNKVIWTLSAQQVVTLGRLFLKGVFNPSVVMAVSGTGVNEPTHVKTRVGTSIKSLLNGKLKDGSLRIISGNVLTGSISDMDGYVGYYQTTISVIPNSEEREFLRMLKPGSAKTRYSLTNTFLTPGQTEYEFNSQKNGEERAMIPINTWENVLPMDIYPNPLYRAILANDIEEMEQLGLLECDDEDFALCSFACPSKIDVGTVIRKGLDILEAESES